jgi:hypothetical protein
VLDQAPSGSTGAHLLEGGKKIGKRVESVHVVCLSLSQNQKHKFGLFILVRCLFQLIDFYLLHD